MEKGRTAKTTRRFGVLAIPMIVALFGLSACGGGAVEAPYTVVTYDSAVAGGEAASVEGILVLLGECLAIGVSDGVIVPSFPEKQVSFTNEGVKLFGSTYALADTITVTGSYIEVTDSVAIPEVCEQSVALAKLFQVNS